MKTDKVRKYYVYIRGLKADHEDTAYGGWLSMGPGAGS